MQYLHREGSSNILLQDELPRSRMEFCAVFTAQVHLRISRLRISYSVLCGEVIPVRCVVI
jgi:hypothetical protein